MPRPRPRWRRRSPTRATPCPLRPGTPGAVARTAPPAPTATASTRAPAPSAPASTTVGSAPGIRPRCTPPTGSAPGSPDQVQQVTGASAGSAQRRRDGGPAGHVEPADRGKVGDHLGADPGHRLPGGRGQHVRHQRRDLLQAPVEHHVIARSRPGGTARHHVTDPCAQAARPGCARTGHDRSDQRRSLGQGRDQARGRGPGDPAGEPERGPDRGVPEVDPVPVPAGDQPRRATRHGEQDAGRLLRPRSDPGEHGRAEQPAGRG